MGNSLFKYCLVTTFYLLFLSEINTYAQSVHFNQLETYQNQQRAINLSVLKSDIKLVEDAPQRCGLRIQIIKFLFENKVTDYHEFSDSLAIECLEEIADKSEQFSESQASWQKADIFSLLRKYSPTLAVKLEKQYLTGSRDSAMADAYELNGSKDPVDFANKYISKMIREGVSKELISVAYELKKANRDAYLRLLGAALNYWETHLKDSYTDNTLLMMEEDYRDAATPIELRKRFHRFLVRLGELALTDPQNDRLTQVSVDTLKYALSDIKENDSEIYQKSLSIFLALSSKQSKEEKEKEEVRTRIRESKDKLAQAISEANSATEREFKNELLQIASQYAFDQKKYRLSADLTMRKDYADKNFKFAQIFFVIDSVLNGCLKENDVESAEYVVNLIDDPLKKSEGIFKIAAKLVELKKMTEAFDKLNDGWAMLEKTENVRDKWWIVLSAIRVAVKVDKTRAFDMVSDFVKTANSLPTPGPGEKFGSEARRKYVSDILIPVSSTLESGFRLLGKEDFTLAYPISQGIQRKEWRLAAQVALETQRKYPLPPELDPKTISKP